MVRSTITKLKSLSYSRALFLYTTLVILMLEYSVWFILQIFVITYDYLVVSTLVMRIECICSVNTLRLILANDAIAYI
jgi:hypothetical protein